MSATHSITVPCTRGTCQSGPYEAGEGEYVLLRTLHNYYHLKRAIAHHADNAN